MEVPVYQQGVACGCLQAEGERQTVRFTARLQTGPGLYRLTAQGQTGRLMLGVLEGPNPTFCRRLSHQLSEPALPLRCGLLERCVPYRDWQPLPSEPPFPTGTLWRPCGEGREVALPLPPGGPFPLTELFCFARVCAMKGGCWVVYRFDGQNWPVME